MTLLHGHDHDFHGAINVLEKEGIPFRVICYVEGTSAMVFVNVGELERFLQKRTEREVSEIQIIVQAQAYPPLEPSATTHLQELNGMLLTALIQEVYKALHAPLSQKASKIEPSLVSLQESFFGIFRRKVFGHAKCGDGATVCCSCSASAYPRCPTGHREPVGEALQ